MGESNSSDPIDRINAWPDNNENSSEYFHNMTRFAIDCLRGSTGGVQGRNQGKRVDCSREEIKICIVTVAYFAVRLIEGFLAVSGNALTAIVIVKNKKLRTNTNLIILSLAVGDFLSGLDTPFYMLSEWIHDASYGPYVCLIAEFIDLLGGFGNIFSIACIALDRYVAVLHPVKYYRYARKNDVGRFIILMWIYIVTFLTLLMVFGREHDKYPLCFFKGNLTRWAHDGGIYGHVVILSLITCVLYGRVWCLLSPSSSQSSVRGPTLRSPRRRGKIVRLLGIMLVAYFSLALPITVVSFTGVLNGNMNWVQHLIFRICWAVWYMNSFVNPFLYVWRKECFRRAIRGLVGMDSKSSFRNTQTTLDQKEADLRKPLALTIT